MFPQLFLATITIFLLTIMNYGKVWFTFSFLFFVICHFKRKLHIPIQLFVIIFIVCLYSMLGLYNYYEGIRLDVYFYLFFYAINCILGCSLLSSFNFVVIQHSICLFLRLMISLILFQLFFYIISKNYIDIHHMLTFGVYESRYENYFLMKWGLIRPTGIAIEPSNMGNIIAYWTVILLLLKNKVSRDIYLYLIFSLFTLSFASILISSSIIFIFVLNEIRKNVNFINMFLLLILVASCSFFIYLFYLRFTGVDTGYDAIGTRTIIFDVIKDRGWVNNLIGNGIMLFDGEIKVSKHLIKIYNIQDSGFIINSLFCFGIISTSIFLTSLFIRLGLSVLFFAVFILLLSKFDYMQPLFWVLMYFIFNKHFLKNKIY